MPIWIPLLMMALGTATQAKQVKNAGRRSRAELQMGRDKESKIETTQRKDVLDEANKFDPTVRQEAMDTKASETEARINDVLSANELTTSGDVGDLPDALLAQRAKSTRDKANTASIMAALSSKVRAPGDTAFDEGQGLSELLADSKGRSSKLGRVGKTSNLLASLEGQTDKKTMMMAGVMQQLGMAMAGGSIMSGLAAPGAMGAAGATSSAVPAGYLQPNLSTLAGIV